MHRCGVLHGDIAPRNVVRRGGDEPDSGNLALIGFGNAKRGASQEELDAEMAALNENLDMDVVPISSDPF